jgi:ferrous iron transport protein A
MTLRDLSKNTPARILGFNASDQELETRLREIGFAEGDQVEALHFGLFGRNPMSVRLNGALIALRKTEAEAVIVEMVSV